mgnify:CR=1 FL=1
MPLKGTTIESVHVDVSAFKHEDTTVDFHISLSNIYGDPVRANSDHTFTAKVANSSGYIGDYPCAIDGTNLLIDSNEFFQLPPDSYSMEIWETWENDDGTQDTAIYPSPSKVLQFTINENIKDKTGEIVKRFDFQEAVENTVKSFLKKHPGSGDVDLQDYAKKSDIQRQLEDYAKKTELPKIVLDERSRVLDINGQELTIPESVDLSGYAKKGEVPQVTYDAEHRSLTVNGVAVDLPASVDLSNYYTKAEMDDKLSKVTTGGTVDLTGYLKVADADKKYATKHEIPDVSGLAKKTDLDDYAKKSAVPVISLDSEARKLTLNGTAIDIPATVDLSGYATKQELPKIIYDQDTKSLTINGTKIELPSNVDLSEYYTKVEVDDKLSKVTSSTVDGIITTDYGTFLQHDPNSVRVVNNTYSDGGDSFMLFDNGAEMHVANGQNIGAINGGWNANSDHIDQTVDHLRNKVAAYMRGDFPIVNGGSFDRLLVGTSSTSWINFAGTVVKNPYRDASKYIWGTAHFTNDESKVTAGERDMIKAWYQVGLFNDYEVVTYCHVVKKEAK